MDAKERMKETVALPERTDFDVYVKQLALKKAQEALEYEEAVNYFTKKKKALLRRLRFWKRHKKDEDNEDLDANIANSPPRQGGA